ncbi:MAG: efflux transporter periplasmic adaptor subunit, partial [Oceanidesulfovibrio sp.]
RDTVLLPRQAVVYRYEEHWVTREDSSELKVVLLGEGPGGTLRVSSPEIRPGDTFLMQSAS